MPLCHGHCSVLCEARGAGASLLSSRWPSALLLPHMTLRTCELLGLWVSPLRQGHQASGFADSLSRVWQDCPPTARCALGAGARRLAPLLTLCGALVLPAGGVSGAESPARLLFALAARRWSCYLKPGFSSLGPAGAVNPGRGCPGACASALRGGRGTACGLLPGRGSPLHAVRHVGEMGRRESRNPEIRHGPSRLTGAQDCPGLRDPESTAEEETSER